MDGQNQVDAMNQGPNQTVVPQSIEPTAPVKEEAKRPNAQLIEKAKATVLKTYNFYATARRSTSYRSYTNNTNIDRVRPLKSVEDKWLDSFMLYRQILARHENQLDGRARVTHSKAHQILNIVVPRIEQAIFGSNKIFEPSGFEPKDKEGADKLAAITRWNMEYIDARSKLAKSIKEMCLVGTSIIKMYWNREVYTEIKRKQLVSLNNPNNPKDLEQYNQAREGGVQDTDIVTVEDTVILHDNADFKILETANFYMHPSVNDINDAPCVEREYVTYKDLKKDLSLWQDVIEANKDIHVSSDDFEFYIREKQRLIGVNFEKDTPLVGNESDIDSKKYQLLRLWTNFPIDPSSKDAQGNVEEPLCEIVVLNKAEVVGMRQSPYWYKKKPYVKAIYEKNLNEAYGDGLLFSSIRAFQAMNTSLSQVIHNSNLILNAPIITKNGTKLPPIINLIGGKVINVPDQIDLNKDFQQLKIPDITTSGWATIAQLESMTENDTGAVKLMAGVPTGMALEKTATGVAAAIAEANVKFKSAIQHYQEDTLKEVVRWISKLNQQFMTRSKQVRIINPDNVDEYQDINVSPEDILIDCDYIIPGATTEIDKAEQRGALQEFMNVANHYQDPSTGGFLPAFKPFIQQFYSLFGLKDWRKVEGVLFPPPPPPQPNPKMEQIQVDKEKNQQDAAAAAASERTKRVRIFLDTLSKLPEPSPTTADLFKKMWLLAGFPEQDWDEVERLWFAGQLETYRNIQNVRKAHDEQLNIMAKANQQAPEGQVASVPPSNQGQMAQQPPEQPEEMGGMNGQPAATGNI